MPENIIKNHKTRMLVGLALITATINVGLASGGVYNATARLLNEGYTKEHIETEYAEGIKDNIYLQAIDFLGTPGKHLAYILNGK